MRRSLAFLGAGIAAALLVSGCALKDPRDSYAYGRADGLWDADYDLLLDWNFPTSANQGRLEAPTRFRPERPAIGVPWATGVPFAPAPVHDKGAAAGSTRAPEAVAAVKPAQAAAAPGGPVRTDVARLAGSDGARVVR